MLNILVHLGRSNVLLVVQKNSLALPAATLDELLDAVHGLHAWTGGDGAVLVAKVGQHHAGLLNGVLKSLGRRGHVAGGGCKLGERLNGGLGPMRARASAGASWRAA